MGVGAVKERDAISFEDKLYFKSEKSCVAEHVELIDCLPAREWDI